MKAKPFPWLIILFLFASILILARQIEQKNIALGNIRPSAVISKINPDIFNLIAGDFTGIISDYLVLQTAQFIGEAEEHIPDKDIEAIIYLLRMAQKLDPYFFTIPYYAEGSLIRNYIVVKNVNTILQTSHGVRTWDWEPGFYLGYNLFYYLRENKAAADILQQASTRSGAPMILGFLAAKLNMESKATENAIQLLQTMLNTTKSKTVQKEIKKRIAGYKGVYILEKALTKYYSRYGRYPSQLSDLVSAGTLTKLPENPYHDSFWYKQTKGKVFFFPFE